MSRDLQYLLDMLQSAELIKTYTYSVSKEEFINNVQLQDAVIRRLLIIVEAARRISVERQQALSSIAWRQINGMRNRLVHEYDVVDLNVVWTVVQSEIPALVQALKSDLASDEQ